MSLLPETLIPAARQLLQLARDDREAARRAIADLSAEALAASVCEAPLTLRRQVLDLLPHPEEVIPLLPEAELCFTCKHVGVEDAGWMLALATDSQIIACFDLDAWQGFRPNPERIDTWMATLAEAGGETLLRAAKAIDPEVLALYLRHHVYVELKPAGDDDWQPPESGQTLEGQFYFVALDPKDDLAPLIELLRELFQHDYWLYFRMMQSVTHEQQAEIEEWALRWRNGRLEDLGFPTWDDAMRIYGFLRSDRFGDIPEEENSLNLERWAMPVWITELPAAREAGHALFHAVSRLDEEERRAFFYAFIALANRVAVADRLELSDAETLPKTIEKAARVASLGLEEVCKIKNLDDVDVLRRASLEHLYRIGVNLAPEGVRPSPSASLEDDDDEGRDESVDADPTS